MPEPKGTPEIIANSCPSDISLVRLRMGHGQHGTGKPDLARHGTQALLSPTLTVVRYHTTLSVYSKKRPELNPWVREIIFFFR